jgi:hypothetical protein
VHCVFQVGEGRACSNLGIVYQLLGEHDAALKLHQAHLSIARQLQVSEPQIILQPDMLVTFSKKHRNYKKRPWDDIIKT